jgi:phospholipase/carboxylesterase
LATWDIISDRRYGPDVRVIDQALEQVLAKCVVNPQRIAVAGFSDGASYALSVGVANGDLFRFVIAFSPGFMAPARQQGKPDIFISHGVQDQVLPIQQCSRRIVPQLRSAGYDVGYREFPDGHVVPEALASAAFAALANELGYFCQAGLSVSSS